jgi:hypothetical protein
MDGLPTTLTLQVIGKDLNPLHEVLYEDASLVFDGLRSLCDSTGPMAFVQ